MIYLYKNGYMYTSYYINMIYTSYINIYDLRGQLRYILIKKKQKKSACLFLSYKRTDMYKKTRLNSELPFLEVGLKRWQI